MRRANIVSGVILAVFGLVMLVAIIPWQVAPGPEGMMSPRLVPNLMMVVIVGLSILLAANNLLSGAPMSGETEESPISRAEMVALVKIGVLFAIAIALFVWVSPLVAGTALTVGTLVALGERRPLVIVAMPAVLLTAIWLLFYKLLGTAIV